MRKVSKTNVLQDQLDCQKSAIYQCYNGLDEVFSLLVMAREYAKSDGANNYTIANGIDGIFSRLIDIQGDLLTTSKVEG